MKLLTLYSFMLILVNCIRILISYCLMGNIRVQYYNTFHSVFLHFQIYTALLSLALPDRLFSFIFGWAKKVWRTAYTTFVLRPTESGDVVDWCWAKKQSLAD